MSKYTIVVVGATGQQGQAVALHLLSAGYDVRALVRDAQRAEQLAEKGAELYVGDLERPETLTDLFHNAKGLFFALPIGPKAIQYADTLLALAKQSDVTHLIYSSIAGAETCSFVEHFRNKLTIERQVAQTNIPYTILRPVAYMETFSDLQNTQMFTGMLRLFIDKNEPFQVVALKDVAAVAVSAFTNPQQYCQQTIELAGDEVSIESVTFAINQIVQTAIGPKTVPSVFKWLLPKDSKQMFRFYAEAGWHVDIPALRQRYPDLLTFRHWLEETYHIEHDEAC